MNAAEYIIRRLHELGFTRNPTTSRPTVWSKAYRSSGRFMTIEVFLMPNPDRTVSVTGMTVTEQYSATSLNELPRVAQEDVQNLLDALGKSKTLASVAEAAAAVREPQQCVACNRIVVAYHLIDDTVICLACAPV